MAATSRVPALIDYLVNAFTAAATIGAASPPVLVFDGPPTTADPAPLVPVLTPVPAGRPSTRPGGSTDITLRAVSLPGNDPLDTSSAARADDVTMEALDVPTAPADDALLEP